MAYDFVADRTANGRPLKMLTVIDELSWRCIAIHVARRLTSIDVLQTLPDLFLQHGPPAHIRSDNGPELTAKLIREWLREAGVLPHRARLRRNYLCRAIRLPTFGLEQQLGVDQFGA